MQRLLVIRGGAIGDFVVTLPVFAALRQAFPQACIEILGHPSRAELAHHPAYADVIRDIEDWDTYRLLSPGATVSDRFGAYLGSFDSIIAYWPVADDVLVDNLRRYCSGAVLSWSPLPPRGVHATDHLLNALDCTVDVSIRQSVSRIPKIYHTQEAQRDAEAFWTQAHLPGQGVVALHPGSGGRHKLWPLEGWATVIDWMSTQDVPVLLICGPAEQDQDVRQQLEHLTTVTARGWVWTPDLTLSQLAAVLARCRVVVSHDSGVAHLAAATGTQVLALFGPTDPQSWGPRSASACVIQPVPAQPLTLANLTPDVVIETLNALWQGTYAFDPAQQPCTVIHVPGGLTCP